MPKHPLPKFFTLALGCTAALAQCPTPPAAIPLASWAAPSGAVSALAKWDPDGPGPLGPHVVCGGDFHFAGTAATECVALFDPGTRSYSALGAGFNGPVRALVVLANGTLVAGGEFTQSGATLLANVASWNGTSWVGIGAGTNDAVLALLGLPNGDLLAGGEFTVAGSVAAHRVARWNGIAWSAVGAGVAGTIPTPPNWPPSSTQATSLGLRPNGDIVVGGEFATAGGQPAYGIAVWNGAAWSSPLSAATTSHVAAMRVLANGDVLASFDDLANTCSVARWDGIGWTQLGGTMVLPHTAFLELANGTLVGTNMDSFSAFAHLMQWNGTAWLPPSAVFPCGRGTALLEFAPGDLWMATSDYYIGPSTVWRWNGTEWRTPADGFDQAPAGVVSYRDGFAIQGGFQQAGALAVKGLARVVGTSMTSIGDVDGYVTDLAVAANGDLLVAGSFNSIGGTLANGLARFDGVAWHAMTPPSNYVQRLAVMRNGDLVVVGFGFAPITAHVQRWDGLAWQAVGSLPLTGWESATSLAELPNGDVVVGIATTVGDMVQRWNGFAWMPMGLTSAVAYDSVDALCVLPNGDLVAGGHFVSGAMNNVARWDGSSWQPMGAGLPSQVKDLDVLPGGVLATHLHYDDMGLPIAAPSQWNGVAWTPVGGIQATGFHSAFSSAVNDNGTALVIGSFQSVHGVSAGGLARLSAGCAATSAPVGTGCIGSAGAVQLSVQAHAWIGSSYRARTTGLPLAAIAVQVFGLASASLPLATVLPSFPGCTLLVSPDVLLLELPTAGAVTVQWSLPNAASLIGQSFRHQTVPVELAASGAIAAVSASNAVELTIGAW